MQTIGIIGAGQLGRMMALAGYPLGLDFVFLDKSAGTPGGQVGEIIVGDYDDPAKLAELAGRVDVLTFDVENVPAKPLAPIIDQTPLRPPVAALETGQDRLLEKRLFVDRGLETTAFEPVDTLEALRAATGKIGLPVVVKTRRLGYDGKGQAVIRTADEIETVWGQLGGVPLIVEQFIPFDFEVSIIGVRAATGECRFYPLSRNSHDHGILHHSVAPYEDATLQARAETHSRALMEYFDYVGVLTIEFFVKDGALIANEIAPRVHNSGHWTIEGARTSQFENHIRAVSGLPLGETTPIGHAAMVNFLGQMPPIERVLAMPDAHYHDYGKSPRPGRKLGHGTLRAPERAERDQQLERLLSML